MSTMDDVQLAAEAFAHQFQDGYSDDLEKGGTATAGSMQKSRSSKAPWHKQFVVLLRRAFLTQTRNPTDTASRLLLATWIGLLTGKYRFRCCWHAEIGFAASLASESGAVQVSCFTTYLTPRTAPGPGCRSSTTCCWCSSCCRSASCLSSWPTGISSSRT